MRVSSVWRCSLIARVVFIWNSGFVFIAGLIMLGFHGFVLVFCLCSVGVILSAGFLNYYCDEFWIQDEHWICWFLWFDLLLCVFDCLLRWLLRRDYFEEVLFLFIDVQFVRENSFMMSDSGKGWNGTIARSWTIWCAKGIGSKGMEITNIVGMSGYASIVIFVFRWFSACRQWWWFDVFRMIDKPCWWHYPTQRLWFHCQHWALLSVFL